MRKKTALILLGMAALVAVVFFATQTETQKAQPQVAGSIDAAVAHWIGRASCTECHQAEAHQWTGSDHDLAMQVPSSQSVTADFDNTSFTHFGTTTTFSVIDGVYKVHTDGPDGEMATFDVAFVFGHSPIEQYLIRFSDGRLQALNVCWDTRPATEGGQRWFHLYPDQEIPADDLFHWSATLQNWNFMCAECHSTNLQRNYDEASNTYDTKWFEIDVSCEGCHGPGSLHKEWADGSSPEAHHNGLVVDLGTPQAKQWVFSEGQTTAQSTQSNFSSNEMETCARCHSRRSQITEDYEYGQPFGDHHRLTLLDEGLYHADGQNQDEVYVYGSFQQSKMYAAGVTCVDCHDPHSGQTLAADNNLCARCHQPNAFDTPQHHFHEAKINCVDCHMRSQDLMVIDGRRDHSLRIPRPDLSLSLGSPNACNDCHTDQSARWAQDAVKSWYGPDIKQGPHFGIALAAGRSGAPGALDRLRYLISADDQPDIARATALSHAGRFAPTADLREFSGAINDQNPLVRAAAVRSLWSSPPDRQLAMARPLLEDSVRDVRLAAAEIIANLPANIANPATDTLVRLAHDMWQKSLKANVERPESQLGLAAWHINRQEFAAAEACFLKAIELEKRYTASYVNYADFLRRSRREAEAQAILREGIAKGTEPEAAHHSLGLMLITAGDTEEALEHLATAARADLSPARYSFVYAVALHDNGQLEESITVLENSLKTHRWDFDSLQTLALYALESTEPSRGQRAADDLVALVPQDPNALQLQAQLLAATQK